ncbi:MAG: hypothetical protein HY820_00260 [Acidobacteria bacterium]|nr:hypothetical protein [Acidobacteriota bacterium]
MQTYTLQKTQSLRIPSWLLLAVLIPTATACLPALQAQTFRTPTWVASVQSGMADTFQLTLGGMFGEGPAWQNKVTVGMNNAWRAGDSVTLYGWNTLDTRSEVNSWQAGIGYKLPVWRRKNHAVHLGTGLQHWDFPSVKTGTVDWLVPGNLVYQTKVRRTPVTVTSDSWTLLRSRLPMGTLLHTQAWLHRDIVKRERVQVSFKHGPAHTYSWNFYGTNRHRVFRYQTMFAITMWKTTVEGGYRKQWGLQSGIQDNNYWMFTVGRTFSRPVVQ